MRKFEIIVEKTPGDLAGDHYYVLKASNIEEAWGKARANWKIFGAQSRVKSVEPKDA